MKKSGSLLVVLAYILIISTIFSGCCDQSSLQKEQPLKGEHKLRKMTERTETNSNISGFFIFGVGGLNGRTTTVMSVKFAWEMNDGSYAFSSLPLEKIRVRLDKKATTPTIKFYCRERGSLPLNELQSLIDLTVNYAVLTVRESDWPTQIHVPLND